MAFYVSGGNSCHCAFLLHTGVFSNGQLSPEHPFCNDKEVLIMRSGTRPTTSFSLFYGFWLPVKIHPICPSWYALRPFSSMISTALSTGAEWENGRLKACKGIDSTQAPYKRARPQAAHYCACAFGSRALAFICFSRTAWAPKENRTAAAEAPAEPLAFPARTYTARRH